jgi:cellulose biosynthesis protein BcsQ
LPHPLLQDYACIEANVSEIWSFMAVLDEIAAQAPMGEESASLPGTRVVTVVNSKGGVGKTTLANNLAVYLRTVDASLPVLVIGLDDSSGPDEMFALDETSPSETTYSALRRGSFDSAIRPGRYGVYYVPSSPRISGMRQTVDPWVLKRALRRTAFPGVVIIDTRSDLGILTQNAIAASDLSVVPVADLASLFTAKKIFDLLEEWGRPRSRARVVLSMLDLRIKYEAELCRDVLGLLVASARRLNFPLFQSFIARSPKVQALATNLEGRTYSILNEANRTNVHRQMGDLAEELLEALEGRHATMADELVAEAATTTPEESEELVAWLRPRTPEAAFAVRRGDGKPLCVHHFPFFLGRQDPGVLNDLAIQDLQPWQVSRRHAHFVRREGRIGVMDLGSTLGTWVNGHQLGGPTAEPGPVFLGAQGGVLILGKRQSPYAFDVAISKTATAPPIQEAATDSPMRAAALAALVS